MQIPVRNLTRLLPRWLLHGMLAAGLFLTVSSCSDRTSGKQPAVDRGLEQPTGEQDPAVDEFRVVYALLVSPRNPTPGEACRILATGGTNIRKAQVVITGPAGTTRSSRAMDGNGLPFWRVDEFIAGPAGRYSVSLVINKKTVSRQEFLVNQDKRPVPSSGSLWKTEQGWASETEALYSAWINALFHEAGEGSSWNSLHAVMQDRKHNVLYNYLGLNEDDPGGKPNVIMEPDCADNPFFIRAYFAWKLGLPFGYHETDRGWLGKAPQTGRWITNGSSASGSQPVLSFNAFMRRLMDAIHSGTARTAFTNDNADYYPVPLTREALRPGVTFADPYGHTLILVKWVPQTGNKPGMLLSVDAQPDGTVAIKRFWKGNFLFTWDEVIGEPGFKAFRPISMIEGQPRLLKNNEIAADPGLIPFSMQQRGMRPEVFYHTMDRVINPKPLDPETALLDLIRALYEQLVTRVASVANGEKHMKAHPGEIIPMPGRAVGVFQAGGPWEDFSTPNRDLRLLIAMDAVLDFPDKLLHSPSDYQLPRLSSPEQVKTKLEQLMVRKTSDLSITYQRTDGSDQILSLAEILRRREAFEMAYNPNDCIEVRWGAPENSSERSTCRRHVSASQLERMQKVRPWFKKRLHPPT